MENLMKRIENKDIAVGIIGLGYVGLPLARTFLVSGFTVVGFDIDEQKVKKINGGKSYIRHISSNFLKEYVGKKRLRATSDFSELKAVDSIIICVPTPLGEHYEPDLKYVTNTVSEVAKYLKKGHIVVLESTTFPGTTDEILLPMLQRKGMGAGREFFLGYSPEREDPGNREYTTERIPKIVSGTTKECLKAVTLLYSQVFDTVVPVSSTKVAESTKIMENIYRSVNIALVNELKVIFGRMGIDIWEVIEAAKTKPFGFQAFYPGPGLGGHCIPIDPFYLTWKAREYDIHTRFIELAGEINTGMPYHVFNIAVKALNRQGRSVKDAKVLILGIAYKPDVDDMRESPALKLIDLLQSEGASVQYNDPYIPVLPPTRRYRFDMRSLELEPETLSRQDLVIIATNHTAYDYGMIEKYSKLIIDTRNALNKKGVLNKKVWKA